jgi:AraC-like DNA-binding protein
VLIRREPAPQLRGHVSSYYGFSEDTGAPTRRREGPGADAVVIVTFEHEWLIDDARHTSFVAGLYDEQVTTEHPGRSYGMQLNLAPLSAHGMLRLPMHTLAHRTVPLEDVLGGTSLVERLHDADAWPARFEILDGALTKLLAHAPPPSPGIAWAWKRLRETDGRARIGELAGELGWSRKRLVARFREEIGLPPKTVARLLRFEHARALAERPERPDWARIAVECGYYDQSHLINDFRAVTGLTPREYAETFFQDTASSAA